MSFNFPERLEYDRARAAARSHLGESAFRSAWDVGWPRAIEGSADDVSDVLNAARRADVEPRSSRYASEVGLTPRELEVLRLVAAGRSNREIAAALFIGVPTVKSHLTAILAKLGLPSRSAATAYAHTHRLL